MMNPVVQLTASIFIFGQLLSWSHAWSATVKAKELTSRYHSTVTECRQNEPAFKCSGLIFRGVNKDLPHFWSLNPLDHTRRSFSTAYLRSDTPFTKTRPGYDAGFIMYPHLKTPPGKDAYQVLCAFPTDARTDFRWDRGCGASTCDDAGESRPCQENGIDSFDRWMKHYNRAEMRRLSSQKEDYRPCRPGHANFENFLTPGVDHFKWPGRFWVSLGTKQCGFNMTSRPQMFKTVLLANRYLMTTNKYAFDNNELKFESWDEANVGKLPIEVIFYYSGSLAGAMRAMKYQKDFYMQTGEMVPIVGIRLPGPGKVFAAEGFDLASIATVLDTHLASALSFLPLPPFSLSAIFALLAP